MKRNYMKFTFNYLVAIAFLMGSVLSGLQAQEVILGSYEFTYGENQDKATSVYPGLTFSPIIIEGANPIVPTYNEDGSLSTTNWGTVAGFGNGRCINMSLTRDITSLSFNITKVEISFKRNFTVAKNIILTAATSVNTNSYETYKRAIEYDGSGNYTNLTLTNTNNLIPLLNSPTPLYLIIGMVATATTDVVTLDKITVYGKPYFMYENFSNYSTIALTQEPVESMRITDDVALSLSPGWTASNLYAFKGGPNPPSTGLFGITATDSAYLTTPAMNLTQPFHLNFKFRSRMGKDINPEGRLNIYMDDNQLLWTDSTTATSLQERASEAFVGTAASKVTFTSPKIEGNQMIVDEIYFQPTTKPALNFLLLSAQDLGKVALNTAKKLDLPLKAFNLTGDVTLVLKSGTKFSLAGNTIAKASAEAGATIQVTFPATNAAGQYVDTLVISTNESANRMVALKAIVGDENAVPAILEGKLKINGNVVMLTDCADKHLQVYTIAGMKVTEIFRTGNQETITLPENGCYLLRLLDNQGTVTSKLLIQ